MEMQRELNTSIIRSDTRIRESVRSLPRGHFQQIRQMFDKQACSARKLATIYERQQKSLPSHVLLHLPVTDDEKLQHTATDGTLGERYRDYVAEYQAFRAKLTNELNEHKSMYPPGKHASHQNKEALLCTSPFSSVASDPEDSMLSTSDVLKPPSMDKSAAISYTDSFDASSAPPLNRTGSSRHYASSLQPPTPILARPAHASTVSPEAYDKVPSSRRLHSSTSLSSTGYDSNSSPSMKSKRNSIATNHSNEFLGHSTYSSSSSPSSDEQQVEPSQARLPRTLATADSASFASTHGEDVMDSVEMPSPLVSRTQIKLNQAMLEQLPTPTVRFAVVRNATFAAQSPSSLPVTHEPVIGGRKPHDSSYTVQTTSFLDGGADGSVEKKIRRWNNVYAERRELANAMNKPRKYPLIATGSLGFQPPAATVKEPVVNPAPPKKPPRTFRTDSRQQGRAEQATDQKVPSSSSSSSSSNSPSCDYGARSASCMDLTAGVSTALSSTGPLPVKHEHYAVPRRSTVSSEITRKKVAPVDNVYEELSMASSSTTIRNIEPPENAPSTTKLDYTPRTSISKTKTARMTVPFKSVMKKGISEPNLTNASGSKSPFSPRGILDRVKRMLPMTTSKQSLHEKPSPVHDSDDSGSTSSETNDQIRTSRLDHVSRVKTIYDTLSSSSRVPSLMADPSLNLSIEQSRTLYDYVVHILPEQEIGYFANGTGCLLSSNFQSVQDTPPTAPIRFKYPPDAKDEATLKYFCFPDRHDSNNNPLIVTKKPTQEYFRFVLTNMHGSRQYGYCSRFFHKGTHNALCIVSPCDMLDVYEKILATATELFLSYKDDDAKKFLEEIYAHRLPDRGEAIHIDTTTVGLYTLRCDVDRRRDLVDPVTLLSLSTDTIVRVFSAILYEQKIIFVGNDIGPLTRLINTFVCLLYPFFWPHTYVPVLPALMLDVIQAPTPYIVGILRTCESYLSANEDLLAQDNSDILVVDIDHDRIRSIDDYATGHVHRGSTDNLHTLPSFHSEPTPGHILPKVFKIELKQEISQLRKSKVSLSLDDCQQRLRDVFMSIFVQSCFNYRDYYGTRFDRDEFVRSKQHTIELFLEWFTRTQIFGLFIRRKFEYSRSDQFARTFDTACATYAATMQKETPQRVTVKSVKRKSATRLNKQEIRF